jgi:hypothetical protein
MDVPFKINIFGGVGSCHFYVVSLRIAESRTVERWLVAGSSLTDSILLPSYLPRSNTAVATSHDAVDNKSA